MRPQEFLKLRDEAAHGTAQEDEVSDATPEEWQDLTLTERFNDLWRRLKIHVGNFKHESGENFDGQADVRYITVEHNGQQERVGLFFILSKDAVYAHITAQWVQGPQEPEGTTFIREESIIKYMDFQGLSEAKQQKLEADLNKLHESLRAYETGDIVITKP